MRLPLNTSSKISIRSLSETTAYFDPVNFRIVELDLSCNQMNTFDATQFHTNNTTLNLNNLEKLNLMKNNFTSIDKQTLTRLVNLTDVNLSSNKLVKIMSNTFSHLKCLTRLDLSSNKLSGQAVQASVFDGLSSLCELNLSHNQFESFEKNVFKGLVNLTK